MNSSIGITPDHLTSGAHALNAILADEFVLYAQGETLPVKKEWEKLGLKPLYTGFVSVGVKEKPVGLGKISEGVLKSYFSFFKGKTHDFGFFILLCFVFGVVVARRGDNIVAQTPRELM